MIRVSELVADPSLELQVLSGTSGLDREVTWSHISESSDAAQWLEGGEILLTTGLPLPQEAPGQVAYLRSLARIHLSCVGLGQRTPRLTDELLQASEELGLPIVRVGVQVPFARISRAVAAGNLEESQHRLSLQIRILESLRLWSDGPTDTRGVFQRLEAVTGFDIHVVDEEGSSLFTGMRGCPEPVRSEIGGLRSSPVITDGYGAVVPLMGRSDAFVILRHRTNDSASGVVVARQVATVAAILLTDLRRRQADEMRRDGEVLASLLHDRLPSAAAEKHLVDRGFSLHGRMRMLAVRHPSADIDPARCHERLNRGGEPCLLLSASDHVLVVTQRPEGPLAAELADLGLVCGVSEGFPWGADMRGRQHEAVWALHSALESGTCFLTYRRAREVSPWLSMGPDLRAAVVQRVLGAVTDYDRDKGAELLHTLTTFLQRERSVAKAAQELYIHPHTLRHRLDRIEALTDLSLSNTADLALMWWALQAGAASAPAEAD